MSSTSKDHRPRVISLPTALNGLNIAAQREILWPCHAFSISIPQKKKSPLNVFEKTILKLTEIESGNTEKIAELTCLDEQLVSFIQKRLNHLKLVDARYELSTSGQELLDAWENKPLEQLEYSVATVFVDLFSGKLLSFLYPDQLRYKKVTHVDQNGSITFLESHTSPKAIRARKINPTKECYWKTVPDSKSIVNALRAFKNKFKRHALLNLSVNQFSPSVPMAEAITTNESPELVFLHCSVLIQHGNNNIFVTDGCGFGFSEQFANYLRKQEWKWISDLKKEGIVDQYSKDDKDKQAPISNRWQYPSVTRRFKKTQEDLATLLNNNPQTELEERAYVSKKQSVGENLFSILEFSLALMVNEYPVPEFKAIFSSQDYQQNEQLLYQYAKKIGFSLSYENKKLLQVKKGAIQQVELGSVKFQPLLALAITSAATTFPSHPLNKLAQSHPHILDLALSLKRMRDPVSHGDIANDNEDAKELNQYFKELKDVIIVLLPDIEPELNENVQQRNTHFDPNSERLKIRIELDRIFGMVVFQEMPRELKELLIRTERMFDEPLDDIMMMAIFKQLCALMENLFRHITKQQSFTQDTKNENTKKLALKRMIDIGFYKHHHEIPRSITSVKDSFVQRSIRGYGASLGANLLALMVTSTEQDLIDLYKTNPSFVHLVGDLLEKRGGGTRLQHRLPKEDMILLKKNVYQLIQTVTLIFS